MYLVSFLSMELVLLLVLTSLDHIFFYIFLKAVLIPMFCGALLHPRRPALQLSLQGKFDNFEKCVMGTDFAGMRVMIDRHEFELVGLKRQKVNSTLLPAHHDQRL